MVVCSFQSMYMTVSTCTHTLPYANLQLQGFLYAYAELFEHLLVRIFILEGTKLLEVVIFAKQRVLCFSLFTSM